jgi:hypothetical protein
MAVNHLTDFVVRYKMQLIAGVAMVVLAFYFLPIGDIIFGSADAAKGDNNSDKNQNPNRFKVCEHNSQPQKCYGRSG